MTARQEVSAHMFGSRLRTVRTSRGYTLHALGKRLGLSAPFLCDVERGARGPLRPEHIRIVANIFKVSRADLMALAECDVLSRWHRGRAT